MFSGSLKPVRLAAQHKCNECHLDNPCYRKNYKQTPVLHDMSKLAGCSILNARAALLSILRHPAVAAGAHGLIIVGEHNVPILVGPLPPIAQQAATLFLVIIVNLDGMVVEGVDVAIKVVVVVVVPAAVAEVDVARPAAPLGAAVPPARVAVVATKLPAGPLGLAAGIVRMLLARVHWRPVLAVALLVAFALTTAIVPLPLPLVLALIHPWRLALVLALLVA
jgi:hypothetical protein